MHQTSSELRLSPFCDVLGARNPKLLTSSRERTTGSHHEEDATMSFFPRHETNLHTQRLHGIKSRGAIASSLEAMTLGVFLG